MRQETRGILLGVAIAGAITGVMWAAIHDGGVDVVGQCQAYETKVRDCEHQREDEEYFADTGRHRAASTAPGDHRLIHFDDADRVVLDCRIDKRDTHLHYARLAECAKASSCDEFDRCVAQEASGSSARR